MTPGNEAVSLERSTAVKRGVKFASGSPVIN